MVFGNKPDYIDDHGRTDFAVVPCVEHERGKIQMCTHQQSSSSQKTLTM